MDKTKILFLKPGATVRFNGSDVGYTLGISYTPENETVNLKNQRYKGFVDCKLLSVSGTVKLNVLEMSAANLSFITLLSSAALTKGVLIIYGQRKDAKYVTLTLNNAYLENTGEIKFDKTENASLQMTFRALLDSDGVLGTIVVT
jgi:hypothetical protein